VTLVRQRRRADQLQLALLLPEETDVVADDD
jgi:hypothetical protein